MFMSAIVLFLGLEYEILRFMLLMQRSISFYCWLEFFFTPWREILLQFDVVFFYYYYLCHDFIILD